MTTPVLALLIREMTADERPMVLSDWKRGLWDERPAWGRALHSEEWWALINHVIDGITLPSVTVWMACHRRTPDVPLCWAAVRRSEALHMYARSSVRETPELAAFLHRSLLDHARARAAPFNPFQELKRP